MKPQTKWKIAFWIMVVVFTLNCLYLGYKLEIKDQQTERLCSLNNDAIDALNSVSELLQYYDNSLNFTTIDKLDCYLY